jgi:hypothetical protein
MGTTSNTGFPHREEAKASAEEGSAEGSKFGINVIIFEDV